MLLLIWFAIDVSKKDLHVAFLDATGKYRTACFINSAIGHAKLLAWCKGLAQGGEPAFCMEATGDYHLGIAFLLAESGYHVSVVNPSWIKFYGQSKGRLNKTDKADAKLICDYANENKPKPWKLCNPAKRNLFRLNRRRKQLVSMITAEKCRRECPSAIGPDCMQSIGNVLTGLKADLKQIEDLIEALIDSDEDLRSKKELLYSLSGFGPSSFLAVVAEMPEVEECKDAKSFAAAAGGNPISRQSGTSLSSSKCNYGGRKLARSTLWMVILTMRKRVPEIGAFYDRLRARGKKHKQAMLACVNKLLKIVYGILKHRRPYKTAENILRAKAVA